ncbi:MAG: hypothetical protein ACI4LJ_06455 [Anaerovoracaceae bacterium]
MKSMKKIIALLLVMAVTLTFIPGLAFAAESEEGSANDMTEIGTTLWYLYTTEETDAQQNGNLMTVGWDYIGGGLDEWRSDEISPDCPFDYEAYFLTATDKENQYRIAGVDDLIVKDAEGNVLEGMVSKADDQEYGKLRVRFEKPGVYTLQVISEEDGVRTIAEMEMKQWDNAGYSSYIKNMKITGVKATAKKGSITVKWDENWYVDGYCIYRSTKKTSSFQKIGTKACDKASLTTKSGLKKGKRYYFKVRGYVKLNGKTVYTKYSKTVSAVAK